MYYMLSLNHRLMYCHPLTLLLPPRPRRTASGNVPQIHGEIERRLTEHSDAVKTLEVWPPTTIQPSSPRAHVRTRVPDMHCRG